ncbi:hypothetical protein EYF80_064851 [Liparis tanakae]|uniref:Uncharacterized protein n=1 Tax=Liparis tanakae TaxID=230148 RepID=A0A4Z2E9T0_9TELE|nr:hypothetical protein EYF80_064851 [Liparis tanakae]
MQSQGLSSLPLPTIYRGESPSPREYGHAGGLRARRGSTGTPGVYGHAGGLRARRARRGSTGTPGVYGHAGGLMQPSPAQSFDHFSFFFFKAPKSVLFMSIFIYLFSYFLWGQFNPIQCLTSLKE